VYNKACTHEKSDSGKVELSHRDKLIRSLSETIASAAAVGDLEVVRIATEAMQRLLDGGSQSDDEVVDLAVERSKRR